MGKITVGLLFGGRSGEHEVSIISARSIRQGLTLGDNNQKYEVIPFYIQKNGVWQGADIAQQVLDFGKPLEKESVENLNLWVFPEAVKEVDVWFPILHGPNGEDGTIQGLLTLMQVPFVGSGVLGSSVGMDKIAMKMIFSQAGLPQVRYKSMTRAEIWSNACIFPKLCDQIEDELNYPLFVKPANLGSSVGISKVRSRQELEKALDDCAGFDRRIIIEEGVVARELECAVLGTTIPKASVVGEITFDSDFYDYETKYTDGRSKMIIPAIIPESVKTTIQEMAITAFQALDAQGLSRVDFFYEEVTGNVYINEINTLPGFTSLSMYPQLWKETGVTFEALIDQLIQSALHSS